jgi:hypothetical protein
MKEKRKGYPLTCCKCGRFIGKDGYPDIVYLDGVYEEGYSYCGPCGRELGRDDKRIAVGEGE